MSAARVLQLSSDQGSKTFRDVLVATESTRSEAYLIEQIHSSFGQKPEDKPVGIGCKQDPFRFSSAGSKQRLRRIQFYGISI